MYHWCEFGNPTSKAMESYCVYNAFHRKFIDLLTFHLCRMSPIFELELSLQEMYHWYEYGDPTSWLISMCTAWYSGLYVKFIDLLTFELC